MRSRWKYPRVVPVVTRTLVHLYLVALIFPRTVTLYYSYRGDFPFPYRLDYLSGANIPNVSQLRLFVKGLLGKKNRPRVLPSAKNGGAVSLYVMLSDLDKLSRASFEGDLYR